MSGVTGELAAAQELQVAALDQSDRVVKQAVGSSPSVRVFPFDGREACLIGSEYDLGDITSAATGLMNVKGMQQADQPSSLHRGQSEGRWEKFDTLAA